jgi:hypothetical protein
MLIDLVKIAGAFVPLLLVAPRGVRALRNTYRSWRRRNDGPLIAVIPLDEPRYRTVAEMTGAERPEPRPGGWVRLWPPWE